MGSYYASCLGNRVNISLEKQNFYMSCVIFVELIILVSYAKWIYPSVGSMVCLPKRVLIGPTIVTTVRQFFAHRQIGWRGDTEGTI